MSLKSWWPGVSRQLKASPSGSKLITAELTDIPVLALACHPVRAHSPPVPARLTSPASWIARDSGIATEPRMSVFSFIPRHKDVFLTMTGIVFCAKLSLFYVYFREFRFAAPTGSPDGGTPEGDGRCR